MLPAVTLGVSLIGLIAFLMFKRVEVRRDIGWYTRVRGTLDVYAARATHVLFKIPTVLRRILFDIGHWVVYHVSHASLTAVRFVERKLLRFVNMVKGRGDVNRKRGHASLFLKHVVEHRDQVRRENGYH